jgi:hypothetical protein
MGDKREIIDDLINCLKIQSEWTEELVNKNSRLEETLKSEREKFEAYRTESGITYNDLISERDIAKYNEAGLQDALRATRDLLRKANDIVIMTRNNNDHLNKVIEELKKKVEELETIPRDHWRKSYLELQEKYDKLKESIGQFIEEVGE